MKTLFIADIQNLFYSARDLYGTDARIDFKALLSIIKGERTFEKFRAVAYVGAHNKDNLKFINVFNRLGYEVRVNGSNELKEYVDILDEDIRSEYMDFDLIIVASGNGGYLDLYKHLKENDREIEVASFGNSISSKVHSVVSKVYLLNDSILYSPTVVG